MHNIKIVRLQSGEDIIAGYSADNDNVVLDNPMHLIFKRTSQGTVMLLMPWLPIELIKDNIAHISPEDVLTIVEPKEAMVEYYGNTINHDQYKLMSNDKKLMENLQNAFDGSDDDEDEEQLELDFEDEMEVTEEDIKEVFEKKKSGRLH